MSEPAKDTKRAIAAAKAICDGRDPRDPRNESDILVVLEQTVATVLIGLYRDPAKAAGMLNEGLIPGVEGRLAYYASKGLKI